MKFKDLTQQQKDIIAKHFAFCPDFDFLDVFADIFGGLSDEDITEIVDDDNFDLITSAVANSLIYSGDQWTVAQHYYSSPADYDEDECNDYLCDDLFKVCKKIKEAEEEE